MIYEAEKVSAYGTKIENISDLIVITRTRFEFESVLNFMSYNMLECLALHTHDTVYLAIKICPLHKHKH